MPTFLVPELVQCSIKREPIMLADFNGFDLKEAFHQVELRPDILPIYFELNAVNEFHNACYATGLLTYFAICSFTVPLPLLDMPFWKNPLGFLITLLFITFLVLGSYK